MWTWDEYEYQLYNPHQDPALSWLLPAKVIAKLNPGSGTRVPEEQTQNYPNSYHSMILLCTFKQMSLISVHFHSKSTFERTQLNKVTLPKSHNTYLKRPTARVSDSRHAAFPSQGFIRVFSAGVNPGPVYAKQSLYQGSMPLSFCFSFSLTIHQENLTRKDSFKLTTGRNKCTQAHG